jgi:hypothetical protein
MKLLHFTAKCRLVAHPVGHICKLVHGVASQVSYPSRLAALLPSLMDDLLELRRPTRLPRGSSI